MGFITGLSLGAFVTLPALTLPRWRGVTGCLIETGALAVFAAAGLFARDALAGIPLDRIAPFAVACHVLIRVARATTVPAEAAGIAAPSGADRSDQRVMASCAYLLPLGGLAMTAAVSPGAGLLSGATLLLALVAATTALASRRLVLPLLVLALLAGSMAVAR